MLVARGVEAGVAVFRPNTESNTEVAKPQPFNKIVKKISEFIIVCKLFLRIRMREAVTEK